MSKFNWTRSDKQKQSMRRDSNPVSSIISGGSCDSFSSRDINTTRAKIAKLKRLREMAQI